MNRPEIKRGKLEEGGWKLTTALSFGKFSETDFFVFIAMTDKEKFNSGYF